MKCSGLKDIFLIYSTIESPLGASDRFKAFNSEFKVFLFLFSKEYLDCESIVLLQRHDALWVRDYSIVIHIGGEFNFAQVRSD